MFGQLVLQKADLLQEILVHILLGLAVLSQQLVLASERLPLVEVVLQTLVACALTLLELAGLQGLPLELFHLLLELEDLPLVVLLLGFVVVEDLVALLTLSAEAATLQLSIQLLVLQNEVGVLLEELLDLCFKGGDVLEQVLVLVEDLLEEFSLRAFEVKAGELESIGLVSLVVQVVLIVRPQAG